MLGVNQIVRLAVASFVVAGGIVVASCSSGSSVATTPIATMPTTTPATSPTTTPTTSPTSNPLATFPCGTAPATATGTITNATSGVPISFPALGGCSATVTFSSSTTFGTATSFNVTTSLAAPAGAPSPLPTSPSGTSAPQTLIFEALTVTNGSITVPAGASAGPTQSVTIANKGTCATFLEAFTAAGTPWNGGSVGTFSGLTATFPSGQNSSSVTLNAAGSPYYLAYLCY